MCLHVYLISQNSDNVCPIHCAATSGKLDVIVELIEKHAVNPRCKTISVCKFASINISIPVYIRICVYVYAYAIVTSKH